MRSFKEAVLDFVKSIPKGKVVSYGQVAAAVGSPRAARQVGAVLGQLYSLSSVPWWRVVNSQGVISIKGNWAATKEQQKALLLKENIKVNESFKIEMQKFGWKMK